jgi:hypothetical protein
VRIERVMTDNALNYTRSADFGAALAELGARHKRTRFYRPQTNDVWAERINRTLLDEWAYARAYGSNAERQAALPSFVDHYNNHRPHTALDGLTPMTVLVNNVSGNHSLTPPVPACVNHLVRVTVGTLQGGTGKLPVPHRRSFGP